MDKSREYNGTIVFVHVVALKYWIIIMSIYEINKPENCLFITIMAEFMFKLIPLMVDIQNVTYYLMPP